MNQYIAVLCWIGAVALFIELRYFKQTELVSGKYEERFQWWFAFLIFLPIIWMAGHRGYVGDTSMYIATFHQMPDTFAELPAYMETQTKDKGFFLLSVIIRIIAGDRKTIYFTILALIHGIAVVTVFRKYSCNYLLSVFLFLASTDYISWMYNGIRQFTAVAIILLATGFILKKKYLPAILMILLASTMHQSALLMIPIVLIAQGKAWNKKTMLFIAFVLLSITFVGEFTSLLDEALVNTQYTNVVSDYTAWDDDGTNPLRVIVYCVPAILSFAGRRIIREENNQLIDFCVNMSIVSAGLYLISMVTSGLFLGRLPIYASLYGYILLPWEIDNLFTPASRKLMYVGTVFCYILFYYYQMHIEYGMF